MAGLQHVLCAQCNVETTDWACGSAQLPPTIQTVSHQVSHCNVPLQMLRAVSDGLVGCLLDPGDSGRVATRSVARELLAGCVLRPLMMWTTPYFANKAVCRLMQEQERRRPAPEALAALDAAKALRLRGHWEFEQRIV